MNKEILKLTGKPRSDESWSEDMIEAGKSEIIDSVPGSDPLKWHYRCAPTYGIQTAHLSTGDPQWPASS